jgi:hypothetical protein
MPRRSRAGGLETAREAGEQRRLGMRGGKGEAHPACGFDDAGGDLDQAYPQGGELGGGKRLRLWNSIADLEHQPVGAGVQHEAHLVGERRTATGAVRGKLGLVQLDQVFSLTASTIQAVVEPLGAAAWPCQRLPTSSFPNAGRWSRLTALQPSPRELVLSGHFPILVHSRQLPPPHQKAPLRQCVRDAITAFHDSSEADRQQHPCPADAPGWPEPSSVPAIVERLKGRGAEVVPGVSSRPSRARAIATEFEANWVKSSLDDRSVRIRTRACLAACD